MLRLIGAALAISTLVAASIPSPLAYARLISIEVLLDGKVIMVGSTSDGGRQNVDEVWDMVSKHVQDGAYSTTLYATEHFKPEMLTKLDGDQYVVKARDKHNKPILRVRYGGQASVRELKLAKVEDTKRISGTKLRNWRLDADQIEGLFYTRLISRRDAARLGNAKRPAASGRSSKSR